MEVDTTWLLAGMGVASALWTVGIVIWTQRKQIEELKKKHHTKTEK